PGELDADVALGNSQRFGVPLGFGGPHAAFFAVKEEFKRFIPGRIIGVSVDAQGHRALRMALQTREQHIKREKATSNICTAQALLANMAAMFAVYHGPEGLTRIAKRVALLAGKLAEELKNAGYEIVSETFFDTLSIRTDKVNEIKTKAENAHINFRYWDDGKGLSISIDETTTPSDLLNIMSVFNNEENESVAFDISDDQLLHHIPTALVRTSKFLQHEVFNKHFSETQMMRYIKCLENRDLSLNTSMISLGSCTMKLNAATQMIPLSWSHWSNIHPFAPLAQTKGYHQIIDDLADYLCEITAFDACSLQPNSGAQGEFSGLMVIKNYFESRGEGHRNVIII